MTAPCELIVGKDQDLKSKINEFMLEKGWESAYISGAIGSIRDFRLTTPTSMDFPPTAVATPCIGPGEVLSFTGEIMKRELMDPALQKVYTEQGPLFVHIHASVATAGGHVYGGGFQSGIAFRAVKIYLWQMK
ncbi:MAG: DNA-binding protein [Oscillospiraceae bacterium]